MTLLSRNPRNPTGSSRGRAGTATLLLAAAVVTALILAKSRRMEGGVREVAGPGDSATSSEPPFPGAPVRRSRQDGSARSPTSAAEPSRRDQREGSSTGIAGVAVDGDTGSPLESFSVRIEVPQANRGWLARLLGSGGPRERIFRNPDGVFEILDLRPDLYKFRFEAEGYFPVTLEDVPARRGIVRRGLRVKLRRVATLEGTVVEEGSGAPVRAATVQVQTAEGSSVEDVEGKWQFLTDLDGRFRIRTGPGTLVLRASRDEFVEWIGDPMDLGPGESEAIVVTLRRGGGIEGTVPGHSRSSSAWVSVMSEDPESSRSRGVQADAEGHFRFLGLAAGRYRVAAFFAPPPPGSASPRRPLLTRVEVEEGRTARAEFPPPPEEGCVVRGRVLRKGEPVARADVSIGPAPTAGTALDQFETFVLLRPQRVTGKDGAFALEGVPPGEASLRVLLFPPGKKEGDLYTKTYPILVPGPPELVLDVALPAGEIAGRVFRASDGSPISGVNVGVFQLEPALPSGFSESVFSDTDARGRYRIVDVGPGEYYVRVDAHPPGRNRDPFGDPPACLFVGPVAVAESTVSLDLALPEGGDAVVRVRDPSGRVVMGAIVSLRHSDLPCEPGMTFDEWAEAEPGEEGVYRADGLRPGSYSAKVVARGFALAFAEGWQIVEGEESAFDVDLVRGTRVLVKAIDEAGSSADLFCVDVADSQGRPFRTFRDVSGKTRVSEKGGIVVFLAPGEYHLSGGSGRGQGKATQVRVGGEAEQEVVLQIETGQGRR
ncbi:MAG: carboxypeptidase-like regulatory domain-containing protein [Planctomycetes bacterium]|nr:carboxypeptidase-like regulatory domain-containing protein [Planctomycetota bacterium]